MMERRGARLVVGLVLLLVACAAPLASAGGGSDNDAEVSLPATLVTEGATPATEAEATFTLSKSREERQYGMGFSSLQYAPVPSFGVKLAVPVILRDPRGPEPEPSVGGIGDVSLMAKYAPLMLPARQLALSGGIKLTFPTGSEQRGLGGLLALAPFLAVGKGLGPFSLQADASYSWQLNRPRTIEAEEEDEPRVRPDRQQQVTANLTVTYAPVAALALIVELNSVTAVTGDDTLNERVQLYVTPGVSAEPAEGWNLRAGIQLPVTSARAFDYNLIVILTRGF